MGTEPKRRGRKPSLEKHEAIVAAALQAFAAKGVEGSTTREIAEAAQTTERTLFKHFGNKDGVARAVLEQVSLEFMRDRTFGRVLAPQPFTRDEFAHWHRDFLTDRIEGATAARDTYRVIFRELLRDDAFRLRYGSKWRELAYAPVVHHLALMQTAGEIGRSQSPAVLAGVFFSLNLSYLLARFALAPEMHWDGPKNIDAIVAVFLEACGRP